MSTNVPALQFTTTGLVIPEEQAILSGVLADIDTAFGGGIDKSLTTPQGQLAQSMTAAIGDKDAQIAQMAANVDPDKAEGKWQDAIGRIYFMTRIAASGTVVTGTCIGLVGTVIPAGSAAQDGNGYIYYSLADATIPAGGSVDVDFQNSTTGPIGCPIGNLSKIYTSVPGWDSVTNLTAGTLGVDVESRTAFEERRRQSVAINAVNSNDAVLAAVLAVPDVIDAYVIDNPKSVAVTVGATSYTLAPHSLYVAVSGGAAADIAHAIFANRSSGCDYNGDTSHVIYDSVNYSEPYPEYIVTWKTPDAVPVHFKVQVANNPSLPADIPALIKSAIIAAFSGADGGSRARIGSAIYAGRYYAGVAATNSNVNIQSITMGVDASAAATSLTFGIDQRPTLDATNIQVLLA